MDGDACGEFGVFGVGVLGSFGWEEVKLLVDKWRKERFGNDWIWIGLDLKRMDLDLDWTGQDELSDQTSYHRANGHL